MSTAEGDTVFISDGALPVEVEVWPLTVRAGDSVTIRIRALPGRRSLDSCEIKSVRYVRDDGSISSGETVEWGEYEELPFELDGDTVKFNFTPRGEHEHVFMLDTSEINISRTSVYSLESDLAGLRPYKGDFHFHSYASDGRFSPALSVIRQRQRGMDFAALTDHGLYQPSLDAIRQLDKLGSSMRVFPGEEVHLPDLSGLTDDEDNPWRAAEWVYNKIEPHIVNFGGASGINDFCREQPEKFRKLLNDRLAGLAASLPCRERYALAASELAFDLIRECGGMAIYSHPFWKIGDRVYVSKLFNSLMFERRRFDAVEIVSGSTPEENQQVVSYYYEQCAAGAPPPLVGVSDNHNPADFANSGRYTLLFAAGDGLDDICSAVKNFRAVGVMKFNNYTLEQLVGPSRLVRYGYFLLREYFPRHDALCRLEGELLELALCTGDPAALAKALARSSAAIRELERKLFA